MEAAQVYNVMALTSRSEMCQGKRTSSCFYFGQLSVSHRQIVVAHKGLANTGIALMTKDRRRAAGGLPLHAAVALCQMFLLRDAVTGASLCCCRPVCFGELRRRSTGCSAHKPKTSRQCAATATMTAYDSIEDGIVLFQPGSAADPYRAYGWKPSDAKPDAQCQTLVYFGSQAQLPSSDATAKATFS